MILRLPDEIDRVLEEFKKISGVSKTNFIYSALIWYCTTKGLISLEYIKDTTNNHKKKEEKPINIIPESIKFCDGDKCEY